MAERDRHRNDPRWNRNSDWGGGGSSDYNELHRRFSEEDQYGRSRDYNPTSDFGRSGRNRGDFGRGDFDPDFQRNSNLEAATEISQMSIDADTTKAPRTGQILAKISAVGLVDLIWWLEYRRIWRRQQPRFRQ